MAVMLFLFSLACLLISFFRAGVQSDNGNVIIVTKLTFKNRALNKSTSGWILSPFYWYLSQWVWILVRYI